MIGPLLLDLSRELGVPLGQAGLLAAAMSLPWALGAPFTGLLSDRLGRRPMIVLALAGVGLATIVSAFAPDFYTLLAARFAAGIFGAFGPASVMAAVGDLFPLRRRGMALGWLNAGFGLGAAAGVLIDTTLPRNCRIRNDTGDLSRQVIRIPSSIGSRGRSTSIAGSFAKTSPGAARGQPRWFGSAC